MPETASIFDQIAHDQLAQSQTSSAKHKWRGKFFSNDQKQKKNVDCLEKASQEVSDFLHPPSSRDGKKNSLDLSIPRLNTSTAKRWPDTNQPSQADIAETPERRRKPPRKADLHVSFTSAVPEIIGEGGDEAELPAIEISRSRATLISQQSVVNDMPKKGHKESVGPTNYNQVDLQGNSSYPEDDLFRRVPLQRIQTGLGHQSLSETSYSATQDDNQEGNEFSGSSSDSRARVAYPTSEPHSRVSNSLVANEPMRSTEPFETVYKSSASNYERDLHARTENSGSMFASNFLSLPTLDLSLSLSNSLTPIPSPPPPLISKDPSSSGQSDQSRQPEYFDSSHSKTLERVSDESSRNADVSNPKPEARSFTIRSLAKNLGDDAITEFSLRVKRFNDIFQIGATVISPLMNISFVQWIRTGAYWFLRGRSELEMAVRREVRNMQASDQEIDGEVSSGLRQAYLDLAKAWWIVEMVTPNHPEPRRFGNAGMSSLMAIVTSFGERSLAEQIGVHLAIIANMRALTMSMKRNNRLPPTSFEMQRLDSRIFVELPTLPSRVKNILTERSQSYSMDEWHVKNAFFPIPVGDTKLHFLYSSFFVDLLFISRTGEHEEVRVPCVLSVLRERTIWGMKAVIASQDGQVNIVIQPEHIDGLSWNDVHWKVKSHQLLLRLSDTVDAQLGFLEKDFKSLWGIHDYSKRVQKGLKCNENEEEVLSTELKSFQSIDHGGSKMFTPDPAKGCSLRLFERKRTLVDAVTGRKIHNGHRLVVVTPPGTKTLRSINIDFGKQRPVLFSYLRGEASAPALLLNLQKPSLDSSMVLTFHKDEERGLFHSLIDGTSIQSDEFCSQPLPLDSFMIIKIPVDKLSTTPGQSFMNALRWKQTRVINSSPTTSPRSPVPNSENLRIWTEGETGSFVDRINLGRNLR